MRREPGGVRRWVAGMSAGERAAASVFGVVLVGALATAAIVGGSGAWPAAPGASSASEEVVPSESAGTGGSVADPAGAGVEAGAGEVAAEASDADAGAAETDAGAGAVDAEASAAAVLEGLAVKGRAPKTGYDRAGEFGTAWLDVDRNGCDTRNDILARDLTAIEKEGPCTVLRGTLADPYTGTTIAFVRGNTTSTAVQIDHVVALLDAWQSGAQQLTFEQRVALANDPLNLQAVDGPTNASKGAGDAATWLPPQKGYRCAYAARQISVKAAYGLWVTPAEKTALASILSACPDEPALTSSFPEAAVAAVAAAATAAAVAGSTNGGG